MTVDGELEELKERATEVSKVLRRQARRPFVFEITGTPKAGKTTLIRMADQFLRDCGWRVHVLTERASECPLPMKGHFLFNTWTLGTMLAGLIDAVDRDDDLIILDRGLFDALIWLESQKRQGQVSDSEVQAFETFVKIERWRRLTDATCTVTVDPQTAMARENAGRLLPRTGSVMNPPRLYEFNRALEVLIQSHQSDFKFVTIPNANTPEAGATALIQQVLDLATMWADPEIAVVSRDDARQLIPDGARPWTDEAWRSLSDRVSFCKRSEVENDERWVQLLACGVQVYQDEVFLSVRRRQRSQQPSERDDSARIWQGCHVSHPGAGGLNRRVLEAQLLERLREDLHLGGLNSEPEPLGFIWVGSRNEQRHLGVFFKVPVEEGVADYLDERQFRTNGRGYRRESSFVRTSDLTAGDPSSKGYTVEQWSLQLARQMWLP